MSSSFYSQVGIPSANTTAIESNVANSQTAATNSAASATNSASSASASAASATSANAADVSATQSKNAAEAAETNSAASAAQSATSSAAAVTAQTASETAKTASELAATNAATSETNAAASAASAAADVASIGTSVADSAASATSAASTLATFQNQYLGAAATAPTLDPDGSALDLGDLWFDTASDTLKVYASGGWVNAGSSVNGTSERQTYTATAGQTTFAVTYDAGFVDCWMNGSKLLVGSDFTATSGTNIVLASGASAGDIIDIIAFGTFSLSTHYTKTDADARFEPIGGSGYGDSNVDTHLNQSSATSGQYLKWNGSDYAWDTVAAGYADSDVDTHLNQSTATTDQFLKWNGSDYAWAAGYANSDVNLHLNQSTATTDQYLKWNGSDYAWAAVPAGYADGDVDTHLNQSSATSGQYLQWNGSDYAWATVSAGYANSDVDAHLLTSGITLDATNDRLGVGTASPQQLIEASAASADTRIRVHSNTNSTPSAGIELMRGTNTTFGADAYTDFRIENINGGHLAFSTGESGTTTERIRMLAGGGLTFNGDTAADNALDDYEEGTFNFTLSGYWGSPSPKLTIPAHYTKIGNVVHFWAYRTGMNTTGYSGNMTFQGLPFTSPSPYSIGTLSLDHIGTYSGYGPHLLISGNDTYGVLHQSNASSWSAIMHNVHTSAGAVYLTGHYKV